MASKRYTSPEGDEQRTDAAVVADLAAQALGVVAEEGYAKVVVVPSGAAAEVIDLSEFHQVPWRAKGTAYPKSVDAFVAYVRRHMAATTTIWVEPLDGKVVAVLNDHGPERAEEWGDHRAVLDLPVTPEWEHWRKRDGVLGSQLDFAEHLEQGLLEIREPDGATLLEIAQSIHGTVTATFRSASRLDNGAIAAQWVEDGDARGGSATAVEIPQRMTLGIAPFYGEQPYEITARIRYRIGGGELRIGYQLDRPDAIVRDCLVGIRDRIDKEFEGHVFMGSPPTGHR